MSGTTLRLFFAAGLAVFTAAVACGGSTTAPSATPTPTAATPSSTLQGVLASATQSGAFTVNVQGALSSLTSGAAMPQGTLTTSGSITLSGGGGTSSLAGTLDTTTGVFTATGGDFTLTGTLKDGRVTGNYAAPGGGAGKIAGIDATKNTATSICGTYTGGEDHGIFNVEISATGQLTGIAFSNKGQSDSLSGQVTGTTLSLTTSEGVTATGTFDGSKVSGTFPGGTFTGSASGCR